MVLGRGRPPSLLSGPGAPALVLRGTEARACASQVVNMSIFNVP